MTTQISTDSYVADRAECYNSGAKISVVRCGMELRNNKPLRDLGIYELRGKLLILSKQSEALSFLFNEHNWHLHGPVDYRVSHGQIYRRGELTTFSDEDLVDTGRTAYPLTRFTFAGTRKLT